MSYQHHWGDFTIGNREACFDCGTVREGHTEPCDIPPELSESRLTIRLYPKQVEEYYAGRPALVFLTNQTIKRNYGKLDELFVYRCIKKLLTREQKRDLLPRSKEP